MVWREEEHPRDEEGKFTFKNGGNVSVNKETPAEILYGKTTKKVAAEASERAELIKELAGFLSASQTLYAEISELKEIKKMKKLQQAQKLKAQVNSIKQNVVEKGLGEAYYPFGYWYAKLGYGKDTVGMLDLAHGAKMKDRMYLKDVVHLENYNDPKVGLDKEYLKEKISSQFKDYNFDINKIKGYFFKNNSEPSKRIAQSEDFKNALRKNKQKILNGENFSMAFPRYSDNKQSNLHFALGHVDIRNGYFDENGNLRIKVYDTYDFNKSNKTLLNQAGKSAMEKGYLKPYFSIHDIIIPKNEIDEILK